MKFPLVGPSYTNQSLNADAQSTMNWYPEAVESGDGNAQVILLPTPGLKKFVALSVSLAIAKSHSGNFTQGQAGATFQSVVTNNGELPTTGPVTVTEMVPSGFTFVSMSGTGWSIASNVASRSDSLAPGASYPALTITVNVASNATSPQVNQICVSGGGLSQPVCASDPAVILAASAGVSYQAYEEDCFFGNPIAMHLTVGTVFSGISGTKIKAGDIGFVAIQSLSFTGAPSYTAITDNLGNTYAPITPLFNYVSSTGAHGGMRLFQTTYASDITVGTAMTLSTTYSPSDAGGHLLLVVLDGVTTLNQVQTATLASGTSIAVPITIAQPCVLIGACGQGIVGLPVNFQNVDVGLIGSLVCIYEDPSTAVYFAQPGTYTPTWTIGVSEANAAAVAAYNLA